MHRLFVLGRMCTRTVCTVFIFFHPRHEKYTCDHTVSLFSINVFSQKCGETHKYSRCGRPENASSLIVVREFEFRSLLETDLTKIAGCTYTMFGQQSWMPRSEIKSNMSQISDREMKKNTYFSGDGSLTTQSLKKNNTHSCTNYSFLSLMLI